jgi:transcriptional regulator with XRE-family HTH domain
MSPDHELALSDIVRTKRIALGLTQQELANRVGLGMTQRDVSFIEAGRVKTPNPARIDKLALVLEIPREDLYAASGQSAYFRHGAQPDPAAVATLAALSGYRSELMWTSVQLSDSGVSQVLSYAKWLLSDELDKGADSDSDSDTDDAHIPPDATLLA